MMSGTSGDKSMILPNDVDNLSAPINHTLKLGRFSPQIPFSKTNDEKATANIIETRVIDLKDYTPGNEVVACRIYFDGTWDVSKNTQVRMLWTYVPDSYVASDHRFDMVPAKQAGWPVWTNWFMNSNVGYDTTENDEILPSRLGMWRVDISLSGDTRFSGTATKYFEVVDSSAPTPGSKIEYWTKQGFTEQEAAALAKWCIENNTTPTPVVLAGIIGAVIAVQKDWAEQIVDEVSGGLQGIWQTAGAAKDSLINGISVSVDNFKKNWQTILGDGLLFGLTTTAVTGLFSKISKSFPLLSETATQATKPASIASAAKTASTAAAKGSAAPISNWIKMLVVWNLATDWIWIQNMLRELGASISGDVDKRITQLHITLSEQIKELNNKINFAATDQDWQAINERMTTIRPLMDDYLSLLQQAGVEQKMPEVWSEFKTMQANVKTFDDAVKAKIGKPVFPEEITITNVKVLDGDTIAYPGHTEVQEKVRFVGIDCHELGTSAGNEEKEYLKSIIGGETIAIKIDPYDQIDMYGRLLGVPFYNGKDVNIMMLNKFGKDILVATKYQEKNKWIDWDEYAKAAEGLERVTGSVKIYTKPAYGEIWIDAQDTGKLAIEKFELSPGPHTILIKKLGYADLTDTVEIIAGKDIEKRYEMSAAGLPPAEGAPPSGAPPAEVFKLIIDSNPSNAKIYIDNIAAHHNTPADEKELKDVMRLLAPGVHTFKATKSGMQAEQTLNITSADNGSIMLELAVVGLPPAAAPGVPAPEIPAEVTLTEDQKTAVSMLLAEIAIYTADRKVLTEAERKELSIKYLGG